MSRRKVPYGLTLDQNSAVRPRRSSSLSFFAQAGSARHCRWCCDEALPIDLDYEETAMPNMSKQTAPKNTATVTSPARIGFRRLERVETTNSPCANAS